MLSRRIPLVVLALLLAALAGRSDDRTSVVKDSFLSGGKKVRVERFEPAGKGNYAAIAFIHGVDGLDTGNAELYQQLARYQAKRGYVVLIVHYFDRTNTSPADRPALLNGLRSYLQQEKGWEKQQHLVKLFADWKEVVRDTLTYARKQEKVDGKRVALAGMSLGGFLATAVASEPEQKVAAVVTLFGGMPRESARTLTHFPPVLILSGDRDRVVPHQESLALRDLLQARKLPCSDKIYEGIDHCFMKDGELHLWSALEAQARIGKFLDNHLRQSKSTILAQNRP